MMEIDKFLDEAETIYKLCLAGKIDSELGVYMAQRLKQRSKIGAYYLRYLCKPKPHFKRALIINHFLLKK